MLSPHDIHHGVILPAFLAVVLLLPALIPKLRPRSHIVLLVALTAPFLFSYMHLFDRPPLPPAEFMDWLFYLAIAAFPIALIIDIANFRLLALPLYFLSTILLLWPILRNNDSFGESATIIAFIAFASFLSYLSLNRLSPRIGGRSMHLILLLLMAATSQLVFMSGTVTLGQRPLIFTAVLAGTLPLLWYLKIPVTSGPLLLIVLLWHGFLIIGNFGANLTPLNALLLLIAPHLAWAAELRPRHWPAPARIFLRFAAVLIAMLTAQLLAWRDFVEATREMQF
jgi:hypothetical protein